MKIKINDILRISKDNNVRINIIKFDGSTLDIIFVNETQRNEYYIKWSKHLTNGE